MSRLDRKSVSYALFSEFLSRLETTQSATAPAGYPREELLELLRRAALWVAVERVSEEWDRVAARQGRSADMLFIEPDGSLRVMRFNGLITPIRRAEKEDVRKYARRLTRGLPELGEVVA